MSSTSLIVLGLSIMLQFALIILVGLMPHLTAKESTALAVFIVGIGVSGLTVAIILRHVK